MKFNENQELKPYDAEVSTLGTTFYRNWFVMWVNIVCEQTIGTVLHSVFIVLFHQVLSDRIHFLIVLRSRRKYPLFYVSTLQELRTIIVLRGFS